MPNCNLCGEPMPAGEEMFKYHGYSGPCPKPALSPLAALRAVDEPVAGETFPGMHWPGIDELANEKAKAFRRLFKDVEAFYLRNVPVPLHKDDVLEALTNAYASINCELLDEQNCREHPGPDASPQP